MESTRHEERPVYPSLAALLGNDVCRVGVVLCVFHHMVSNDLRQMEHAVVAGEWMHVRELAHRTAWGCRFIGEDQAADALDAIEHSGHDAFEGDAFVQTFWSAHGTLRAVLDRAATYAGVRARGRTD
ncbi:hypothetical protein [Dyella jiangningensis]|uniref:hypothetical protein n=1 Tax=Dyella jiangningensis TaxID=1379159 RepID=UPI0011BDDCCD|nr:hypothetical protein [Dyella jiangningensis]